MELFCKGCQQTFSLSTFEVENHSKFVATVGEQKIGMPLPSYCSDCSNKKRLSWLNYSYLYSRPCDKCHKDTVSMYRPDADFVVYCSACYLERETVTQNYDKSKDFLSQFEQLLKAQPRQCLNNDSALMHNNCEYTNYASKNKNCYLLFGGVENEDCYYCSQVQESRNSADATNCVNLELCYEMITCYGCYHSAYLVNCRLSNDCYFSYDLNNCHHCLFSSGLRNKEYYIFNKPYTKEEYEKYWQENIVTTSYMSWQKLVDQFYVWYQDTIRKNLHNRHNENCLGNDLQYSKNTSGFFMYKGEDCRNLISGNTSKNLSDVFGGGFSELCYQGVNVRYSYNVIASAFCARSDNVFYSLFLKGCKNCFGCIGISDKEYCILNKQYSQEEYEELALHIIHELQENGSWGEFFPDSFAPFHYEETFANDVFPTHANVSKNLPPSTLLPDNANDTDSSITKQAISCQDCDKQYRITEQELDLYKRLQIPLPRSCYHCRSISRNHRRPNFRLYKTTCSSCTKDMHTNFPTTESLKVYCEDCYQDKVVIN